MNHIKSKQIILWSIFGILFAIWGIAFYVYHQAASLKQQQHETNKRVYRKIKDTELENYVELAGHAIDHLYHSGKSDADTQKEAKDILRNLSYGHGLDGYFFLFDSDGVMLMHPRQPELEGQALSELDDNGSSVVRLIQRAKKEGTGFVNYDWRRPSNEDKVPVPKRAYVSVLKNWGWVLGSGSYLDNRDAELKKFDEPISINIIYPMIWIIGISSVGLVVIILNLILSIKGRSEVADEVTSRVEHGDSFFTGTSEVSRTQVFISYSHADAEWLRRLRIHLKPSERSSKLECCWDDNHIKTGDKWFEVIQEALAKTKVAVFLVSAEFLASDFIHEKELPPLLEAAEQKGTIIMSVIVGPCDFENSPLFQFQAHNSSGLTLEEMDSHGAERELMKFSKSIEEAFSIADAPAGAAKG